MAAVADEPSETTVFTKLNVLCDPSVTIPFAHVIPRRLKPPET